MVSFKKLCYHNNFYNSEYFSSFFSRFTLGCHQQNVYLWLTISVPSYFSGWNSVSGRPTKMVTTGICLGYSIINQKYFWQLKPYRYGATFDNIIKTGFLFPLSSHKNLRQSFANFGMVLLFVFSKSFNAKK